MMITTFAPRFNCTSLPLASVTLVSDAEFLVKVVGYFDSNLRSFGFAGNERCNDLFDSPTQSGARIRINIHIGPMN